MTFKNRSLGYLLSSLNPSGTVLALDFNSWEPHVRTTLEISKFFVSVGYRVEYEQNLRRGFPSHSRPYWGSYGVVKEAQLSEIGIFSLEKAKNHFTPFITSTDEAQMLSSIQSVHSLDELKKLSFRNLDYGLAIVSTLVSSHKKMEFSTHKIRKLGRKLCKEYVANINYFDRHFSQRNFVAVIVFNGRFLFEKGVSQLAELYQIPVIFHEALGTRALYLAESTSVHSPDGYLQTVKRLTFDKSFKNILEEGIAWFEERIQLQSEDAQLFYKNWHGNSENSFHGDYIAIFPTSDDEIFAISNDWEFPNGDRQVDWIARIATIASESGLNVVIRLHPNLATRANSLTNCWMALSEIPNVFVLGPKNPTNSYELIRSAQLIIATASTVAMESGFLGKPTLSVGTALYEGLKAIRSTRDLGELAGIFVSRNFKSLVPELEGVVKFGYVEKVKYHSFSYLSDSDFKSILKSGVPNYIGRSLAFFGRKANSYFR